ncbi:MAG TPA: ATP-binding cassette domain-containing protein [Sphingobacteriaceae bacterium]|nr:ATP-binding cassette domain-containing protein [Sphingobacteriaceae bacterium]
MEIILENIGRRFNRDWIFKGINKNLTSGNSYAVLGPNGSGKSTLLQLISGSLSSSEGTLQYIYAKKNVGIETAYQYISIAAPYLQLIEEFTLNELIAFHFNFKKKVDDISVTDLLKFDRSGNKQLKYFSSGMKQRVKLALAVCSDVPVLILDEPTSNLDAQGIEWYLELLNKFSKDRLVLIGSNQEHEYTFCNHRLNITDYK